MKYDESVDIWSLGVLLYEMFHLKSPFKGENSVKIYKNILSKKIRFNPGFDEDGKDLILKMLKYDPDERILVYDIFQHPFIKKHLKRVKEK